MSDRDYAAEMAMLTKYGVSIDIEPITGEWGVFLPNYAPLCESGVFSRDPYERGASFPDFHSAFDAAVEACKRLEEPCSD